MSEPLSQKALRDYGVAVLELMLRQRGVKVRAPLRAAIRDYVAEKVEDERRAD